MFMNSHNRINDGKTAMSAGAPPICQQVIDKRERQGMRKGRTMPCADKTFAMNTSCERSGKARYNFVSLLSQNTEKNPVKPQTIDIMAKMESWSEKNPTDSE